jgi:hypothetical protein
VEEASGHVWGTEQCSQVESQGFENEGCILFLHWGSPEIFSPAVIDCLYNFRVSTISDSHYCFIPL